MTSLTKSDYTCTKWFITLKDPHLKKKTYTFILTVFSHFTFSVPTGGAAAEEQEVRVAEAALQAAQACGGGLLPHGSALQPPQVSRLQTLEELKKTVLPPPNLESNLT